MELSGLMKQAQELQEKMQRAQEEVANLKVIGEAGGGLVKVLMSGRYDVARVSIDATLIGKADAESKEILEDLVAAAVNDAVRKVETETKGKMGSVMGGLKLPPGMKLPF